MSGFTKLKMFFDEYPITVIWFPFSIYAIFIGIHILYRGDIVNGILIIVLQLPWLFQVFAKYDTFMKNLKN